MKKSILRAAMAVFAIASLASCDEYSNDEPYNPPTPSEAYCYVLSQGVQGVNIDGALTEINANFSECKTYAFKEANGRSLGNTPQCAVTYGSRIYIGVYESNVIEVVDRVTLKSEKQISLANAEGQNPRSMAVKDGKVYVSMYNGYVSRLDTASLAIDGCVQVGPNPDIIAIHGDYLYVPNSDGMNYMVGYGTTASKIDLKKFEVVKTFTVGLNPVQFLSDDRNVYLVCRGNYADVESTIYKLNDKDELEKIAPCSYADAWAGKIFMINAPWGVEPTYSIYDGNNIKPMAAGIAVDSPTAIAVDPERGYVIIGSNSMDGEYASYTIPGYCKIFSLDGSEIGRYDTGVCPNFIFF